MWMRERSTSKHLVLATPSDARYQVGRHTPLRLLMQPSVLVHHAPLSRHSTGYLAIPTPFPFSLRVHVPLHHYLSEEN